MNFRVNFAQMPFVSWSMERVEQLDSVIIERLRKQGEFLRRIYRAEFAKDPYQPCNRIFAQQSDCCAAHR